MENLLAKELELVHIVLLGQVIIFIMICLVGKSTVQGSKKGCTSPILHNFKVIIWLGLTKRNAFLL